MSAWGIAVATRVIFAMILTLAGALSWAAEPGTQPPPIRGEIVLARASHPWMSQQIEEPCILPNPKVPGRLIMFYSAVASSNRVVAAVGKAWADTRSPFRWHQDEANPIFGPAGRGWDSTTIRLDAVLYIPEEDAYYIDGAWEMWGVACDRAIVTRPDCAPLYIPGPLAGSPGR